MGFGIFASLVFILTLALALISTAQAFEPFSRRPEAAPAPIAPIDLGAAEPLNPYGLIALDQPAFFVGSAPAQAYELGRSGGAPVGTGP